MKDLDLKLINIKLPLDKDVDLALVRAGEDEENRSLQKHESLWRLLELKNRQQDIAMRKGFATSIFTLISRWLGFIALILTSQIILMVLCIPVFDTAVLIAIMTTTTISVIGIFLIVARNLFPDSTNSEEKKLGWYPYPKSKKKKKK